MTKSPQAMISPVGRWTRPGFIDRNFGKPTPDTFMINRRADSNIPIEIKFGGVHLRWQDGQWTNLNLDEQPTNHNPTLSEISTLQKENAQLQVECEILLHMLTVSEMTKAKCMNQLNELKSKISTLVQKIEADEQN